jgi:hypothetical protein
MASLKEEHTSKPHRLIQREFEINFVLKWVLLNGHTFFIKLKTEFSVF